MTNVVIKLSMEEMEQAAIVGVKRNLRAIFGMHRGTVVLADSTGQVGPRGLWGIDIEAAAAEMAVAKYLDVYWADDQEPDYGGDVGNLGVRSTEHDTGHLLIYDRDPDDKTFVLVITKPPWFKIVGGMVAKDAKDHDEWREETKYRVPCWAVPQDVLTPPEAIR